MSKSLQSLAASRIIADELIVNTPMEVRQARRLVHRTCPLGVDLVLAALGISDVDLVLAALGISEAP